FSSVCPPLFFCRSGALRALPSFLHDALPILELARVDHRAEALEHRAERGEAGGRGGLTSTKLVERALRVAQARRQPAALEPERQDRKSTRLNSSHRTISYAVFCLKKKTMTMI